MKVHSGGRIKVRAKKIIITIISVLAVIGITIGASNAFDAKAKTTYADIEKFPESYKEALYALKEKHPNWTFEVMDTGLNWSEVVYNEMNPDYRSLVPTYFDSKFVGRNYGDGWACATQEAVEYYLDPRNWLTEDYIFQFEKLTYNDGTQGIATVQKVLQNTFMSGYIQSDAQTNYEKMGLTYAQAFFDIGNSIGVSPVHLATRVKQEQGTQGTSDLISGVYPGYKGYYNYYNIQASGKTHEEIVRNGLNEAKSEGWNNRYAALIGGSQKLANRYILRGQDTLYLQKFDVDGQYDGRYWHQYMQNLAAPSNEGRNTKRAYESAGLLDEAFVFKIPVYKNMVDDKVIVLNVESLTWKVGTTGTPKVYCGGEKQKNSDFTWTSDNTKIATVDKDGKITAVSAGKSTITCSRKGYDSATIIVTVKKKSEYAINFKQVGLSAGQAFPLEVYKSSVVMDGTQLTWKSSNTKIATVDASGNVTAAAVGKCTITAYYGSTAVASCEVSVLNKNCVTLNVTKQSWNTGNSARFKAYIDGTYTDGSKVKWSSSNTKVATVDANGVVTAVGAGNCYIYCTVENGTTASCLMKVMASTVKPDDSSKKKVTLNVSKQTWEVGHSARFKASVDGVYTDGNKMQWSSSNTKVATVDANGVVTAVGAGTCYIYCTTTGETTASCTMIVEGEAPKPDNGTKKNVTLNVAKQTWDVGHSARFKASVDGVYTDGNKMQWSSSNTNVATVDANGVVTAVGGGTCYIYCTIDGGTTASCTMIVNGSAVNPGDDTKPDDGKEKVVTLNVGKQTWDVGHSARFKAYVDGVYTDGNKMQWSSSDTNVATVDNNGVVTAVGVGTCYIYCTVDGGTTASCTMIVK